MSIEAVIWDLGGVLVRTEDHTPRQKLAEKLGMTYTQLSDLIFSSESARMATRGEITTQEHWENVRAKLALSPREFPRLRKEFWRGDNLDTELVDYIRGLRQDHTTALLSNAWDNLRQVLIEEWKIVDAFDEIVISAEVGLSKPDTRIYQLTLEQISIAPGQAVFIDDFPENVERPLHRDARHSFPKPETGAKGFRATFALE